MVKKWHLLLLTVLIAIATYWANMPVTNRPVIGGVRPQPTPGLISQTRPPFVSTSANTQTPTIASSASAVSTAVETPIVTFDEVAIDSLRNARVHGDERAPPIDRSEIDEEMPTADELRDEAQYHQYEQRQEMKLKAAFVTAATPRLKVLDEQLDTMRTHGMSAAAIAEAQAKRDALAQMTLRLQHMHPELQPSP